MPYYNKGYTRVKSARSFKPSVLGFKKRPFKKSYKRHHRSGNSATTSKGKYSKLVELLTFSVDDFTPVAGRSNGYLVLSNHAPMYAGPKPTATPDGLGLPVTTLPRSIAFLKTFQNCYLSKIKVTPLMNYSSDLKLVFEKNNIPIGGFKNGADPYFSQPETQIVHMNSIDTSKLIITGPGTVKSYQNKSTYSPDWLFYVKSDNTF